MCQPDFLSFVLELVRLVIALDSVTIPGSECVNERLDDKSIEIGLGIHGEAGTAGLVNRCCDIHT